MPYTKQASGSVKDMLPRLEHAAKEHHLGVLGMIDLKTKMIEKGVPFYRDCVILEVCNPKQAKKMLEADMAVSTVFRFSRRTGKPPLQLSPTVLIGMYEDGSSLQPVAEEVERTIIRIVDTAAG